MEDHQTDGRDTVTTTSRIRVWWLRSVKGYRIDNKRRVPHESPFGEIYYKNTWVMVKKKTD